MNSVKVFVVLLSIFLIQGSLFAEENKVDDRYPFRTDWANSHLDWYKPKNLEFPPHHSDRRIGGEFISIDYVRRKGTFRKAGTGELVNFTMPPYGVVSYLNAQTHMRNVPVGVHFLMFLLQDEDGKFTRLVTAQDQFTMDKSHAYTYKVKEVKADKIIAVKHSIKKAKENIREKTFLITEKTKCFNKGKQIALFDIKEGDEILVNLYGKKNGFRGYCSEVYVGLETHDIVEQNQKQIFIDFQKKRGLPGWVTHTQGNEVEVALFSGKAKEFHQKWMKDFALNNRISVVVANKELRTWNPPVDKNWGSVVKIENLPVNAYGYSGVKLTVKVNNMLEGFRRGRVVRLFGKDWKLYNPYYGESLMNYGYKRLKAKSLLENPAMGYPEQFPFRTDYSNRHLEWYKIEPGVFPPPYAEHRVFGELVSIDKEKMTGTFALENSGEKVEFSLFRDEKEKVHKEVSFRKMGEKVSFKELQTGQRYRFHTFKDKSGQFSIVTDIQDEYSFLKNDTFFYTIRKIDPVAKRMEVTLNLPDVINYNKDFETVPDLGVSLLNFTETTRFWNGSKALNISDLKVEQKIRVNISAELPNQKSACTDIWLIEETTK